MGVGKPDGEHHVASTHVEGRVDEPRDVELLQSHLATLLKLGLVLAVLRVLKLHCHARSACLELYLGPQYPLGRELVVESQHKARYGDGVTVVLRVAILRPGEAVDAVVLESGNHFAISTNAEFPIVVLGCGSYTFFNFFD